MEILSGDLKLIGFRRLAVSIIHQPDTDSAHSEMWGETQVITQAHMYYEAVWDAAYRRLLGTAHQAQG